MTVVAAVAFVVAVVAALAQAVTGFGSAMLVVPLLTLVVGPQAAVVSATTLSAIMSAYAMIRHRGQVAWGSMLIVSGTALFGMPVGLLALLWLNERILTGLIGGVLLVFLVVLMLGVQLPQRHAVDATAGFLSGTLLTSTGVNGPPLVAALQAMRLPPEIFRATLLAALCVQDLAAVGGFGALGQITPACLVVVTAGLPGLALGWLAGDRLFARLPVGRFRRAVLMMLALSASLAIARAIFPA
ncbi:MAG TPA: sulfite exporter TauE/SafE family protein [Nocardioidaceae bacterium]|nr:sulfite exporter TauE/SafE family protein [Nocardioidaceae bacterium]